jgi:hypothetical protein
MHEHIHIWSHISHETEEMLSTRGQNYNCNFFSLSVPQLLAAQVGVDANPGRPLRLRKSLGSAHRYRMRWSKGMSRRDFVSMFFAQVLNVRKTKCQKILILLASFQPILRAHCRC